MDIYLVNKTIQCSDYDSYMNWVQHVPIKYFLKKEDAEKELQSLLDEDVKLMLEYKERNSNSDVNHWEQSLKNNLGIFSEGTGNNTVELPIYTITIIEVN